MISLSFKNDELYIGETPFNSGDPEHVSVFPFHVYDLVKNGTAEKTVAWLGKQETENRAALLSKPRVVEILSDAGFSEKCIAFIKDFSPFQQAAIIEATGAMNGLSKNGQGSAAQKIRESCAKARRTQGQRPLFELEVA